MIREERGAAFWQAIADHPAVAPTIYLTGERVDLAPGLRLPHLVPLAATHGGVLFDVQGDEAELHAMFLPGHTAEAAATFRLGYEEMIRRGARLFRVNELEGIPTSRPPKSHGWRVAGGFGPGVFGRLAKPWTLTVTAWRASPAYRRMA